MEVKDVIILILLGLIAVGGIVGIIIALARGEVQAFIKEKMAEAEKLYKNLPKPEKSKAKLKYVLDAVNEKYKISKLFLNIKKFIEKAVEFHNSMNGK